MSFFLNFGKKHNIYRLIMIVFIFIYFFSSILFQNNQSFEQVRNTITFGSWYEIATTYIMDLGVILQFPFLVPIISLLILLNTIDIHISSRFFHLFILVIFIACAGYSYYFMQFIHMVGKYLKNNKVFAGVMYFIIVFTSINIVVTTILFRNNELKKISYYIQQQKLNEIKKPSDSSKKQAIAKKLEYTVKEGDTLWALATIFYNSGFDWWRLQQGNRIYNPQLIYPNQKLFIPQKIN